MKMKDISAVYDSITIQEFVDTLNNSFFCRVNTSGSILFSKLFKEKFLVSIKEYGEIEHLKSYISFEQLYEGNKVDSDVRLSLDNLVGIESSDFSYFKVRYSNGDIITIYC